MTMRSLVHGVRPAALLIALMATVSATGNAAHVNRQGDGGTSRGITGQVIDTTFSLERGALLDLSLPFGEITVTGWNRDDMRVRASAGSGLVTLRISSSGALLRPTSERGGFSGLRYEVTVPAGVLVMMRTTSERSIARGVRGDIEARNISGRSSSATLAASPNRLRVGERLRCGADDWVDPLRADVTSGDVAVCRRRGRDRDR